MRDNMTNQEEAALLKKWWDEYGKSVVIAVIIGLGLSYGWRYWLQYKVVRKGRASMAYERLISNQQAPLSDIQKQVKHIINQYSDTAYPEMAQLFLAKKAVDQQQFKPAAVALNWVIGHSQFNSLKQLAQLRLARIDLQKKQYVVALNLLAKVNDAEFLPQIEAVRGDIYFEQNQQHQAHEAYRKAILAYAKLGGPYQLLTLKLSQ